jgi:glycolate oxidase FAD binding subunit
MSAQVYEPPDATGVAALLHAANNDSLRVFVRGASTKTPAPEADVVISTMKLTAAVDHVAGDLVATLPAGISLDAANDVLRRERQWLPLDPPRGHRATIGGIIATNDSGPHRHRFGAPRDLIIGVELALASGRRAKAGGRVVKNVAGYDLSKLMCGSLGTLAVVTSATFKLSPVAPYSQTVVATAGDLRKLAELALALSAAPITPTAIELQSPPHRLLVRFETTEGSVAAQTKTAATICAAHGATTNAISGLAETDAWRAHESRIFSDAGAVVKIAVLPTDVADILPLIQRLTTAAGIDCSISGRAALGIVLVRLDGPPSPGGFGETDSVHGRIINQLRREAAGSGGHVMSSGNDGSLGNAEPIMRAVKACFDPNRILNAGLAPWN